jgi:hypothetical protein
MDDEQKRTRGVDKVSALTSDRVAEMSDQDRATLARDIAGRRSTGGGTVRKPPVTLPYTPARGAAEDAEAAAQAMRLQSELGRTERRLHQIERRLTSSRYQMREGGRPTGRYARLARRADRLERQLRSLR